MLNPFKKIFPEFRRPIKNVQKQFATQFPSAMNVEWTFGAGIHEAIFYADEHEVIARFDKKGDLIDYKINLDIHNLPKEVRLAAEKHGEIMNAISINKKSGLDSYEIIFRDDKLTRFTMLTSSTGTILGIQLL